MGVTHVLARYAARRAHVLVVEVPGRWALRVAAERRVTDRGWQVTGTPADADVFLVCGSPGPGLTDLVDRVWDQLPGPRVRINLEDPQALDEALDSAATQLANVDWHHEDARSRTTTPGRGDYGTHKTEAQPGHEAMDHSGRGGVDHSGHEGMDHSGHGGMNHSAHEAMADHGHAGTDHSGHEAMDHSGHGGMEMAPHGIPLAGGGEDRDRLEMDVLHLPLGPVLRHWPAGLVLRVALQGDLVVDATVKLLRPAVGPDDGDDDDRSAASASRLVDHAADVLALAGWADGAWQATRVRDLLLDGRQEEAALALRRLHRRVARSRLLRWSLGGAGRLNREMLDRHGLPASLEGDAYDRLLALLDAATDESAPNHEAQGANAAAAVVRALPQLVSGLELAEVRLLVASLALDTTTRPGGARHG